jgi:hypothetical protein
VVPCFETLPGFAAWAEQAEVFTEGAMAWLFDAEGRGAVKVYDHGMVVVHPDPTGSTAWFATALTQPVAVGR